jgi:hypothetical protein
MNTPPQPGIVLFAYLLQIVAAVLAVTLARRRPEHRPVAWFLCAMTAIDWTRLAIARAAHFDHAVRPHEGAVRLAFHLDELGFVAWPAGLAALALVLFTGQRPRPAFVAWAMLGAALVVLYPADLVRGAGLQRVYLVAHLAALFVAVAALERWSRRREEPGPELAVMLVLAAVDVLRLVPYAGSIFGSWAGLVQPANVALYGTLAAVQGGTIWVSSRAR